MDLVHFGSWMWILTTVAMFLRGAAGAAIVRSNAAIYFVMRAYRAQGLLLAVPAAIVGINVSCWIWLAHVAVAAARLYYGMEPWSTVPKDDLNIGVSRCLAAISARICGPLTAATRNTTSKQTMERASTHSTSSAKHPNPCSVAVPTRSSSPIVTTNADATCHVGFTLQDREEARWRGQTERQAEEQRRAALLAEADARARAAAGTCVLQQPSWTIRDIIQTLEEQDQPLTQDNIIHAMVNNIIQRITCSQPASAADAAAFVKSSEVDMSVEWAPQGGWDASSKQDQIQASRTWWQLTRGYTTKEKRMTAVQRIAALCAEEAHRQEVAAAMAQLKARALARGMVA